MIVYLSDKEAFREDVLSNRIEEVILHSFKKRRGSSVGTSEIASWRNSLVFMDRVLGDAAIPNDAGVGIEYGIPNSGKRIDFLLTGEDWERRKTAVIIELKQWSEAEITSKDAIVRTFLRGMKREVPHPSYQAWCYAALIEDYNETVRTQSIGLRPCAYLHNCEKADSICHPFYREHLTRAPVFLKDDAAKLRDFIRSHIHHGDKGRTIYEIDAGRIRPSKNLADSLLSLLQKNREFVLIDDQKLVYETALDLAHKASEGKKQTLIVEGGPGTGKSVVAINLLVELTNRSKVVKYVTKNSAPRAVYEAKLKGHFSKDRFSNLFTNSGSFIESEPNTFDALVVDEAHRLNQKSGMFKNLGENQIKELIEASKLSVFFVDGAQRVTMQDIGDVDSIRQWAARCGSEVTGLTLESQFRCNGSDGYLAWVDQTLGIRETENPTLEGIDFQFKVCDSATELRGLIRERNRSNNKARMVAGYCWDWVSKKKSTLMDIVLDGGAFAAQWNLGDDGNLWILKPNSVEQVGCIHTCQGLEVEYVGVIFGPDLVIRGDHWVEFPTRRSRMDSSIKGWKKLSLIDLNTALKKAREIIRNTYRTLMTRGQKGCFVYSVDPETNAFLKEAALGAEIKPMAILAAPTEAFPFRLAADSEARPFENCIPCYPNLRAAVESEGGGYSHIESFWGAPPEPFVAMRGYFLVKLLSEAIVPIAPGGSWCLFRTELDGSRLGKVLIVRRWEIPPREIGEIYPTSSLDDARSVLAEDGTEVIGNEREAANAHVSGEIVLTTTPGKADRVIAELVAVLG